MTAHKNRGNSTAANWQTQVLFYLFLSMIVSLLISRVALSVSTILFVAFAVVHKKFSQQLKYFLSEPLFWMFSFLFFIPFISGLWSSDLDKWSDVVRIKLPLLFLPLAFAGQWTFSKKQWQTIASVFILCIAAGCVWSLADYLQNASQINESYQRAKTILTPLEDDHVRYSWQVGVGVILLITLWHQTKGKSAKLALAFVVVFFIIYLHVLSARTGLLSLYIFLLVYGMSFLHQIKKKTHFFTIIACTAALPLLAYFTLPTFKARLHYNLYDLSFVQKTQYLPGSSDGARIMSIKAGWQVLRQNPLGVGAGDIMMEADKWYASHVPQVLSTDKFYPSSEWLMYGGFAGWPGVVLFTAIMLVPFFRRPKKFQLFWIAFHLTAACSFAFDMGLEVQYGVLLYALVTFWWWKWLNENEGHQRIAVPDQIN
jgi:O-antigen ligase